MDVTSITAKYVLQYKLSLLVPLTFAVVLVLLFVAIIVQHVQDNKKPLWLTWKTFNHSRPQDLTEPFIVKDISYCYFVSIG